MKYIISNDLKFLKSHKNWLVIYYALFTGHFLFNYVLNKDVLDLNLVIKSFGLKFSKNWIVVLYFLFHIVFFCYVSLNIFLNDLKNDKANLFLRINSQKWFISKILSICLIIFLLEIFPFILIIILNFLITNSFNLFSNIFIVDILFLNCCSIFTTISVIFIPFIITIFLLIYLLHIVGGEIILINKWLFLIYFLLGVIFGLLLIRRNKCILFERN